MKELKTIIVKYYELEERTLACYVDVKPRLLRYQSNAEPMESFNWLQLDDWVLFQDKLEELFKDCLQRQTSNFEMKIMLRENVELFVKQKYRYKQIYKDFTKHNKPPNKNIQYFVDCFIRFRETNYLNGDSEIKEMQNGFEGFVDKEDLLTNELETTLVSSYQSEEASNRNLNGFQGFNESPEKNLLKPGSSGALDKKDCNVADSNESPTTSDSNSTSKKKVRKKRDEVAGLTDSLTVEPANRYKRVIRRPSYIDFDIIFTSPKRQIRKRQMSSDGDKEDNFSKQENDKPLLPVSNQMRKEDTLKKSRKQRFNETKVEDFIIEKVPVNDLLNKRISNKETPSVSPKEERRIEPSTNTDGKQEEYSSQYPSIVMLDDKLNRDRVQIEETRQIQKMFELMIPPPPKEVRSLSLKDMSAEDIFSTFNDYKESLDKIFYSEKHKDMVRGYKGNDHFLVMNLTKESTQHLIMKKLSDIYEGQLGKSGAFATLFANALMPEWLLSIFMKRFNFTRQQAIQHLKDEEKYKIYLESQQENSFLIFNT